MKRMYHNTTACTVHVGGRSIPPGEAREVEESHLPRYTPPPPVDKDDRSELEQAISALLAGTTAEIAKTLPSLEDIEPLLAAEKAGANRKGVIEAIETERLRRASEGGEA